MFNFLLYASPEFQVSDLLRVLVKFKIVLFLDLLFLNLELLLVAVLNQLKRGHTLLYYLFRRQDIYHSVFLLYLQIFEGAG
jgi:uncharacterized membrane protein YciS (DUF1049 family)